jgi:hypothetical protein
MDWKDTRQEDTRRDAESISDAEEAVYELVAREIGLKSLRPGLFAKAFSEAGGDEVKAIAIYIKYRVAQIKDDTQQEQERRRQEQESKTEEERKQIKARWRKLDEEDQRIMEHEKRIGRKREAP